MYHRAGPQPFSFLSIHSSINQSIPSSLPPCLPPFPTKDSHKILPHLRKQLINLILHLQIDLDNRLELLLIFSSDQNTFQLKQNLLANGRHQVLQNVREGVSMKEEQRDFIDSPLQTLVIVLEVEQDLHEFRGFEHHPYRPQPIGRDRILKHSHLPHLQLLIEPQHRPHPLPRHPLPLQPSLQHPHHLPGQPTKNNLPHTVVNLRHARFQDVHHALLVDLGLEVMVTSFLVDEIVLEVVVGVGDGEGDVTADEVGGCLLGPGLYSTWRNVELENRCELVFTGLRVVTRCVAVGRLRLFSERSHRREHISGCPLTSSGVDRVLLSDPDQLTEILLVLDHAHINLELIVERLIVILPQNKQKIPRITTQPKLPPFPSLHIPPIPSPTALLLHKPKVALTAHHLILLHLDLRVHLQDLKLQSVLVVRVEHLHLVAEGFHC